jgi:heterodisulfide reductase subunit C/nitrate reductase gamma subunit
MPERVDFWGIPQPWGPILVYTLVTLSFLVMFVRFGQEMRLWRKVGRPENRLNRPMVRLWRVFEYAILQLRVLRQRYPGIMHVALAWSFFVFFMGTALATINGHFFVFLVGNPYLIYKLVLDLFVVVFLIGAALAAYRRFVTKPARLTLGPDFTFSLILLVFIVLNGLVVESLHLAIERPAWASWAPVGWALAQVWIATGASDAVLHGWHLALYTIHFLTVGWFFITLPVGTLVHILSGSFNIFYSNIDRPLGKLAAVPQTPQGEMLFTSRISDLSWKQLLDADACTECGRCQDACPAYASNQILSPKQFILAIKENLHRDGPKVATAKAEAPVMVGESIKSEQLWACTTCSACMQECPVMVEHVDTIVDMRRYLVNEGQVDSMLQDTLANLGRYGNSFGQSERARAKWALTMEPKIKDARREEVEYLWFVGDYASYNPYLTDITRMTAEVFQKAGLDFGILYDAERNAGNDVRRVGEEGLFEILVEKNCAALDKAKFKAIVTTDPHSYNTLKHEYPQAAL